MCAPTWGGVQLTPFFPCSFMEGFPCEFLPHPTRPTTPHHTLHPRSPSLPPSHHHTHIPFPTPHRTEFPRLTRLTPCATKREQHHHHHHHHQTQLTGPRTVWPPPPSPIRVYPRAFPILQARSNNSNTTTTTTTTAPSPFLHWTDNNVVDANLSPQYLKAPAVWNTPRCYFFSGCRKALLCRRKKKGNIHINHTPPPRRGKRRV